MRKIWMIVIGLVLMTMQSSLLSAETIPTDIAGHPYRSAVQNLFNRGIVQGYGDGTYKPNALVNRAEMLKILIDARYPDQPFPSDLRCFADMNVLVPQWYARTTCIARDLGIVGGYSDGTFRPSRNVNLAEALKMALLTFDLQPDYEGSPWYLPYLSIARDRGILLHLLTTPGRLVTRGEMAAIVAALVPPDGTIIVGAAECGNGVVEAPEQCDDGNTENGDGCSKICIVVPEPVYHPFINIEQNAAGTLTTIAQGQRGVTLLRFTAVAGRQDTFLKKVAFMPSIGSLSYAQHYKLALDRDGDGTYETIVQNEGRTSRERVVFDVLNNGEGVRIPEGINVRFEVRADLASSLGPVTLGLKFATDDTDYIGAIGAVDGFVLYGIETDNSCQESMCWIRVNTQGSTNIIIRDRANLFVTADSVPITGHQLLGGTTTVPLLRFKLRAEGEDIDVRSIRIDGGGSSIESLLLYAVQPGQPLSGQPFAQATNGQCGAPTSTRFCANLTLSTLAVSPLNDVTVVAVARMKNDQLGAQSGQSFSLTLTGGTGDDHALEARGRSSNQELSQNDSDGQGEGEIFVGTATVGANTSITTAVHDVVLSKIALVAGRNPGIHYAIPGGLGVIGGFTIAALPHTNTLQGSNDVIIRQLTIHVTAQNVQIDPNSYTLRNPENPSTGIACTAPASTGSFDVTCASVNGGDIQSRIGQGQSANYELSANVTNTQISPGASLLLIELTTFGQRNVQNSILWNDDSTNFSWVDIPNQSIASTQHRSQ